MQIFRAFGFTLLICALCVFSTNAKTDDKKNNSPKTGTTTRQQQQLVESVDIQGNRRLKDDDLLYYIKTRPGDVFNRQALERDLQELLSLNFFDKVRTRVLTEEGVRGGVNVIFEVAETSSSRTVTFAFG